MPKSGFSARVEEQALARCGGRCETCGGAMKKYELDHFKPRALGGDGSLANCRVVCLPCHLRKTMEEDMPRVRKADRQGKTTAKLQSYIGRTEIARRFRVK